MQRPNPLLAFLCFLGFLVVCVCALTLPTSRPFAGAPGIERAIADDTAALLEPQAPGAVVSVSGRNVTVDLPEIVTDDFDRDMLRSRILDVDGVRSLTLVGEPVRQSDSGAPAVPATSEDDPGETPTEAPEPTAEATVEPTAAPSATPVPEPTAEPTDVPAPTRLSDAVAALDLSAIEFKPGTAELTAVDEATLSAAAVQLEGFEGAVNVQVHTDNVGDPDVNLLLSQDRADAVADYLRDQGVTATLTPRGFGGGAPIADNSTEQGRAENRRVELVVEGN